MGHAFFGMNQQFDSLYGTQSIWVKGFSLYHIKKYDDLFGNMLKSYQARQISLLELIDFIDTYKDTKLKLVEQHNSLIKSIEDVNYTTNSNIISIQ